MKARRLAILLGLCFSASTVFSEMYKENVVASFYADKFNGRRTASGEIFDTNGYTAAHKTLPFGTVLRVTNLDNGKSVNVRVNDRGPFVQGREIDVSKAAAAELDMLSGGSAKVSLEIVDEAEGPVSSWDGGEEDDDPYGSYDYGDEDGGYASEDGDDAPVSGIGSPSASADGGSGASGAESGDESLPPPPPKEDAKGTVKKETKTVTTTTTTVVVETPAKRWDIQLGAYTNEGNAKVMAHKLLQAGFDNVAYQKVGNIIRVVLRDIDEADLDRYQTRLDEDGFSSYIVRERKNIIKKD